MATMLTAKAIENAKGKESRYELPDGGSGLYLIVQPSGGRSWAFRYRVYGKPRKLTLGSFPLIPLADKRDERGRVLVKGARTLAGQAREAVEAGRDPALDRKSLSEAGANTLKAICESYLQREAKELRSKDQIEATLKRLVYPELGDREIDTIRRSEINDLLDDIEDERGPVMSDRTLAYLRKIMNWHAIRSDNFNSPIVRGMARTKPSKRSRDRILTDDELRTVWRTAEQSKAPFECFVRFILLTMARRNEAARMEVTELTGDDWIIPAARYKSKLDHVIPLSQAAKDVLASALRIEGVSYVFTTGSEPISGFSKFKADFDKECGVEGWTLHDLRRTARSLMSHAGVEADIAERCLGHAIGGVRGVYDRYAYHVEKKAAFEALAQHLSIILNPQPAKVRHLRG